MSQPIIAALLAAAIAVILTAAIALTTHAGRMRCRAISLRVVGIIIVLAAVALNRADFRINFTDSVPIGIYRLSPTTSAGLERGILVAVCAPPSAAAIGLRRGYLGHGPCTDRTELLLKSVAAVAGDEIRVTTAGVTVNARLLARSRPLPRDRFGRTLILWPCGRFRLAPDQVWLYAADDRSWDSRYFGPVSVANIKANAVPLLTNAFRL